MPGKAIGTSLSLGYPGTYSRNADCVIDCKVANSVIPFGAPVVQNEDNTYSAFGADHTAKDLAGVAVRIVKQQNDYFSENVDYRKGDPTDVLKRGSIVVRITSGTPKSNTPVFIRIAENEAFPDSKIGDFVAQADSANTVQLDNVVFTTGKTDATGVAEITLLTRKA